MKLAKAKVFLLFLGLILTVGLLSACNTILPFDTTAAVAATADFTATGTALTSGTYIGVSMLNLDIDDTDFVLGGNVNDFTTFTLPAVN